MERKKASIFSDNNKYIYHSSRISNYSLSKDVSPSQRIKDSLLTYFMVKGEKGEIRKC